MLLKSINCILFFILFFSTTALYSQAVEAELFYPDGRSQTEMLDNRAFFKLNTLKVDGSGKIIPLQEVSKVESGGKIYEPKSVALNKFFQGLDISEVDVQPVDTVLLLQKLIGGTLNLYFFIDRIDGEHWFIEKEGTMQELIQVKYKKKGKVGTLDRYKGVFNLFTSDCTSMDASLISKLRFNQRPIEKLVEWYNKECGASYYQAPKQKWDFDFGFTVGYQKHKSKFDIEEYNRRPYPFLVTNYAYELGAFVKVPLSRKNSRFFIILNPSYLTDLSFQHSNFWYDDFSLDTISYNSQFKADYINTVITMKYNIPADRFSVKPFIEAGTGFRNVRKRKRNRVDEEHFRRPIRHFTNTSRLFLKRNLPNNMVFHRLRVGAEYRNLEIGLTYSFGSGGITNINTLESHSTIGLDVRYAVF